MFDNEQMVELVSGVLGDPEKRHGQWAWWLCPSPAHEDTTPSFGVRNGFAHCFACGGSWGPVGFLVAFGGQTREQALRAVGGERYQFIAPRRQPKMALPPLPPNYVWQNVLSGCMEKAVKALPGNKAVNARLEMGARGIRSETWERYGIGYHPKWEDLASDLGMPDKLWYARGLTLPSRHRSKLWSVNVRTGRPIGKYMWVAGGAPVLFGLEQLQGHDTIILLEGEMDALTAASKLGHVADVVGLRGASNGIDKWEEIFWPYERVIHCMDANDAGDAAREVLEAKYPDWESRRPPEQADDIGNMVKDGMDVEHFLLDGILL